jgi:hypothetical protein
MLKLSKSIIALLCLTLILPVSSVAVFAQAKTAKKPVNSAANDDIKISIRTTMEGQGYQSTQYIKGPRERNEMNIGVGIASITQCDLQRTIQINDKAKTYMVQLMNGGTTTNEPASTATRPGLMAPQGKRGGIVSYTNNITDTGERKEMFGFTARHLKTSMTSESSPDACNQDKMRMETDGWYIDLNYGLDCQNQAAMAQSSSYGGNQCRDQYRFKNTGSGKLGFALDVTTTIYGTDGRKTVMKREVVELTRTPLDTALFEVPAGYTEVKDYQQLMGIPTRSSRDDYAPATNKQSSAMPAIASQPETKRVPVGPKKAGVIRVGIVLPKTQMGQGFAGTEVAEPVRNTLMQYLNGTVVEILAIEARVDSQIALEAKQKECDYVLETSVTQKQSSGGLGGFMKKISPVGQVIPSAVGSANTTAGASTSAVTTTVIYSTSDVSGNFKAKDEVTVTFKLVTPDNDTAVLANTLRAKAKSDGEDVLSPVLKQAATAVLQTVTKG